MNRMNINNATPNYATSSHSQGFSPKQTSNKRAGENTAPRVSIVPEADVSPLLALPDELLLKIANDLPLRDIKSLASTNRRLSNTLNLEEKLQSYPVDIMALPLKPIEKALKTRRYLLFQIMKLMTLCYGLLIIESQAINT